eukprot:TRINITY_DN6295_c0_g1_i2.p1 TRINITY_DN6295_c0_g1~~TRINITY_DN6295_c0_g1_i2.p1  ORF type:complete len:716 (+),score=228.53 TRINITY_DN6295_c0_g1_i2:128-2275(+)
MDHSQPEPPAPPTDHHQPPDPTAYPEPSDAPGHVAAAAALTSFIGASSAPVSMHNGGMQIPVQPSDVPVPSHPMQLSYMQQPQIPYSQPPLVPSSLGFQGPPPPEVEELQPPEQPPTPTPTATKSRSRKKRRNGCVLDTEAGPVWWSEQDKNIIAAVIAQEQRLPIQQRYERNPPYDWNAVAPDGMTADQAQTRYKQLSEDIPRRRTNLELAHIAMKNYYHALIRGKVLTTEQFGRISHMRRQPGKLKAKDLYPGIPKKPMSAFLLWAQDNRERISATMESKQAKHIQKALSEQWKLITPEEKQPYQQLAAENMTKYYADMAAFYEQNPHAKRDRKLKGVPLKDSPLPDNELSPIIPPPNSGIDLYKEDLKRARQGADPHAVIDEDDLTQQASTEWHSLVPEKQAEYHRRLEDLWKDFEAQRLRRPEEQDPQYMSIHQQHIVQQQQMQQQQMQQQQMQQQQMQHQQHHQHQQQQQQMQHQMHMQQQYVPQHHHLLMEDPAATQRGMMMANMQAVPPKPPNKPTAYKIFVEENREVMAANLPDDEKKTVQAKLREAWKSMSNKERKPYKKKARAADDEYIVEMAEYHRLYGQSMMPEASMPLPQDDPQQMHAHYEQQQVHFMQMQQQQQQYHQQQMLQQHMMLQQQPQPLDHQALDHAQLEHLTAEQAGVPQIEQTLVSMPEPEHEQPHHPQAPEMPAPAPAPAATEHHHEEPPAV